MTTEKAQTQIIDVRTRRVLLHVARTSASRAIAAALRKAMLAWGIPVACKMDNGADYERALDILLPPLTGGSAE